MDLTEAQRKAYLELRRIYDDVLQQARQHPEQEYWQGKKDGLRCGHIFLCESMGLDENAESLRGLQESSPLSRGTDLEILRAMVEDAVHYIREALWMARTGEGLHPLSRVNWKQWISWYKWAEQHGLVKEVLEDGEQL